MGGGGVVGDNAGGMLSQGRFTRDLTNDINYRVRGAISWDVRQQTEYGALRTYVRFGAENNTPGFTGGGTTFSPFWDRAFLEFAGFTVGRARSFFDIFTYWGIYTYTNVRVDGDTDISGQNLWAYTAQLGNGFSATLSLEDPATRKAFTFDATTPGFFGLNGSVINDNAFTINNGNFGFRVPDLIARAMPASASRCTTPAAPITVPPTAR
jgi:Porin subfamily